MGIRAKYDILDQLSFLGHEGGESDLPAVPVYRLWRNKLTSKIQDSPTVEGILWSHQQSQSRLVFDRV